MSIRTLTRAATVLAALGASQAAAAPAWAVGADTLAPPSLPVPLASALDLDTVLEGLPDLPGPGRSGR